MEKKLETREDRVKNKWVGTHVSTTGGVFNAPKNAKEIGARAFALFLKKIDDLKKEISYKNSFFQIRKE